MRKILSVDDVRRTPFSGVSRCHLSLDGQWVAYSHQGNITIFNLEKWRTENSFEGDYPRWSPADSNVLAYLKSNHSGVFIRRVDGAGRHSGGAIGLVKTGEWDYGGYTLEWSFDGQFLATAVERTSEETGEGSNRSADGKDVEDSLSVMNSDALVVLDVATGAVTFEAPAAPYETYECVAWHPSGNWLTVLSNGSDPRDQVDEHSMYSFETDHCAPDWHLFDIDLKHGRKKSRVGPRANEMNLIKWSPDGTKLALAYSPYRGETRPVCAMMEQDSDKIQILSEEYYCDMALQWGNDSRKLFFGGLKGMNHRVVCVDTASNRTKEVVNWIGRVRQSGLSQDGRTLLVHWRGLNNLRDVYVVSLDTGRSKAVTHFSDQLDEYELPTAEVVEWQSNDGLTLQGVVVSPYGKSMSPERPTIVFLHGGPIGAGEAVSDPEWMWLTTQGFQIFAPDFRGSQQYQFVNPPNEEMNYRDVMSGIEWLVENEKCDPLKMVLSGHSYGAFLGAYIIGQTDRFRAAVLSGGSYGYSSMFQLGLHAARKAVREDNTWKASVDIPDWFLMYGICFAEQVETPVLLFQGEHDEPIEAETYAEYLSDLGKKVEFVLYRGEGHDLFQNKRGYNDRLQRKLQWFRKHLDE